MGEELDDGVSSGSCREGGVEVGGVQLDGVIRGGAIGGGGPQDRARSGGGPGRRRRRSVEDKWRQMQQQQDRSYPRHGNGNRNGSREGERERERFLFSDLAAGGRRLQGRRDPASGREETAPNREFEVFLFPGDPMSFRYNCLRFFPMERRSEC